MAFTVAVVETTAAGSGAGVAIDRIGTTDFQQIKLIGGQTSATTGVEATTGAPAAGAVGVVARIAGTPVVTVTSTVPVLGTVAVTINDPGAVANQPAAPWGGMPVQLPFPQYVLPAGVHATGTTPTTPFLTNVVPAFLVTTAVPDSAITAPVFRVAGPVTITPTTFTVNTAPTVAGASVVAQVSGTVTITPTTFTVNTAPTVAGASVTAQVSGTVNVGTVATILGTQIVSIAQTSVSVAAIPTVNTVVAVSGVTAVSAVSTIVTILGTQVVTIAQTSVSVAAVPTVNTVVTILGTQIVSIAQTSVSVAAVPTVNTVVTILGTQVVTLATGGSVAALDVGRTQVLLMLSATSVGISGTTLAFTIYQGFSQVGAGTTMYVVPAGKTFRILSGAMMARNSVTSSPATARLFVLVSTALPTWTSTVPVALAMAAACSSSSQAVTGNFYGVQDVAAGVTVGIAASIATSGATVDQAVVAGYLFP